MWFRRWDLIFWWCFLWRLVLLSQAHDLSSSSCEPVRIPACMGMPYNLTRMPNLVHQSTQENAILSMEQYDMLVRTRCSRYLVFFLCAMYAPICTFRLHQDVIPPCRNVCEEARRGCEPIMNRFNVSWPKHLVCSSLPLYEKAVCITPEAIVTDIDDNVKNSMTGFDQATESEKCRCSKIETPTKKSYLKKRFHYVIKGKIILVEKLGELTLTKVVVQNVIKNYCTQFEVNSEIMLLSTMNCACPRDIQKEYLIMGFVDIFNKVLNETGIVVVPWKNIYSAKIRKWEELLHKSSEKRKKKKHKINKKQEDSSTQIEECSSKEKFSHLPLDLKTNRTRRGRSKEGRQSRTRNRQ